MRIPPDPGSRDHQSSAAVTVEQIRPDLWRAAVRDAAGATVMTADAPTADLAFARLRERSIAAGHAWTIYGTDEP